MSCSSHIRGCALRAVLPLVQPALATSPSRFCFPLYGELPADRGDVTRAHVDCRVVKLRLPGRRSTDETTPDPSQDPTDQLLKGGGKGRPTPKRSEAQGRR